jgi:hypothetical protein
MTTTTATAAAAAAAAAATTTTTSWTHFSVLTTAMSCVRCAVARGQKPESRDHQEH